MKKIFKKNIFKHRRKIVLSLFLFALLANVVFFPSPAFAKFDSNIFNFSYKLAREEINNIINRKPFEIINNDFANKLPESNDLELNYERKVVFTAYNSEVGQCDDSPCITANGFNVCKHDREDTIAMNGIKMGTKVRIPELYGDRVFVVRDRMNSRYSSDRGDIWMKNKKDAIQFGVKLAKVEILK